jgi:hypothetical protein
VHAHPVMASSQWQKLLHSSAHALAAHTLRFTVLVAFTAAGGRDTDSCGQLPAGDGSAASSISDDGEASEDAAAVEQQDTKSEGAGSSAAASTPTHGCIYHLAFYTSRRLGGGTSAQVRHYEFLNMMMSCICRYSCMLMRDPYAVGRIKLACHPVIQIESPERHTCTGLHRADWASRYDWAAAAAQTAAELPRRPCCRSDSVRARHQVWCKRRV